MVGMRVQPWPGEPLWGAVVRVEGDYCVCHADNGDIFMVSSAAIRRGQCRALRPVPVSRPAEEAFLVKNGVSGRGFYLPISSFGRAAS